MKLLCAALVIAVLAACGSGDDALRSDASDRTGVQGRSVDLLRDTFDELPFILDPSIIVEEDAPARLVVKVGRTYQSIDDIEVELSRTLTELGFSRTADDETVWTDPEGVRVDIGARPTLLEIDFVE